MDGHFLTEIEIEQFKCFSGFKAVGFKRVNLIGGKNNIGKTAFVEACYVNVHSDTIEELISAIIDIKFRREKLNFLGQRELTDLQNFFDATSCYIANSNFRKLEFKIVAKDGVKIYQFDIDGVKKNINARELSIASHWAKHIGFIDNFGWADERLVAAYQALQKQDKEGGLNRFVGEFDNSIENFKVIGDKPQCKTQGGYRDIVEFGDGLKHYISIICGLYACENGYLFIDEIDNGIHYSQLERLWELILTLSKTTHCQVFATTHSKEMLEAFARVAKKLADEDISYTILVKNKQQEIKPILFDYGMLLDSVAQGHEVRGW